MKKKKIKFKIVRTHLPNHLKPLTKEDRKLLELLEIPRILDRSKWTKREKAENEKAWDDIQAAERAKALVKQRAKEAEMAKWNAERVAKDKAKAAREERRAARRARKVVKLENANKVLGALEAGYDTVQKIREHLGLDSNKSIRQGLKLLIKSSKVEKVPNKRRYRVIFGGRQETIIVSDKGTRVVVSETAIPVVTKKSTRTHLPLEKTRIVRTHLPKKLKKRRKSKR